MRRGGFLRELLGILVARAALRLILRSGASSELGIVVGRRLRLGPTVPRT